MIGQVKSDFGGLGILVNNAGFVIRKRFAETQPEEWHKQINTCLYGAIHCCHAAGPLLEASGHGRIISIIGDLSRVGESGLAIVAAARAGTVGLMKSLAREMGRFGVTCNSLALGLIETAHDRTWVDANRDKFVKVYQIRRLGLPSDVAPMVSLLASDAGAWITGQVLQHQRRVQHGLRWAAMLHTEFIAPVPELLERHAAARPEKVAYWDSTRSVTYSATCPPHGGHRSESVGETGVREGDKVALCLPNGVDWIEACFACLRAGAVVVPISHEAAEGEISYRSRGCRLPHGIHKRSAKKPCREAVRRQ